MTRNEWLGGCTSPTRDLAQYILGPTVYHLWNILTNLPSSDDNDDDNDDAPR